MELTHINVGVLDLDGNMVYKTSEAYIFRNSKVDVNEIISTIIYAIKNILSNPKYPKENIIGVGIGVHGLVNSKEGISIFAPAFHWRDVPMQSIIEKELDMKVLIDNDVRVMALGEKWFGIARTCNDFVLFSLGEGIGGSLYINGNLYYGSNFGAGEIGHINVTSKPYQCDCGNKGCLTTVASEQGIIQRMKERIHEGEDTILNHQDLDTLTFDNICEAAVKGDTTALNLLEQTGNYIGRGLGIIVNLLNPEKIVLTGNVLKAKTFLIDHIRQKVSSKSLENNFNNTEITVSKLGDSLGIIGAGTLVLEDLFSVNH